MGRLPAFLEDRTKNEEKSWLPEFNFQGACNRLDLTRLKSVDLD